MHKDNDLLTMAKKKKKTHKLYNCVARAENFKLWHRH